MLVLDTDLGLKANFVGPGLGLSLENVWPCLGLGHPGIKYEAKLMENGA